MPTAQRPRLLLLIPHLGGGGAEQVTALLARGLPPEKYDVHLGLVTRETANPEQLLPCVTIHPLGAKRVRNAALQLLRLIWRLKPDVIVSGMAHLNFMVLLLRPFFPARTQVLVRQNGTASSSLRFGGLPPYTRLLYRLLYPRADRVICQTNAMAADLSADLGIRREKLTVLPSPVDVDRIRQAMGRTSSQWIGTGPHLLAVGRLSREKGIDLLLAALATLRERFPDADLVIAGTGTEEAALKTQCRHLHLETAVRFAGQVDYPHALFPGATLFVLSSRHEGLPNALLEAAAGGLPIVTLPASVGIEDLLRNQPGVWLASGVSAAALASSLIDALTSLRHCERFPHPFVEEFRLERSIKAYEALIDSTLVARQS